MGLSQDQLAHLLGTSQVAVSLWERDTSEMSRLTGFVIWLLEHHPDRAALLRLLWQYQTHQRILGDQLGAPETLTEHQQRLLDPPPVPRPWLLEGAVHEDDYPWPGPQPRAGYFQREEPARAPSPPQSPAVPNPRRPGRPRKR